MDYTSVNGNLDDAQECRHKVKEETSLGTDVVKIKEEILDDVEIGSEAEQPAVFIKDEPPDYVEDVKSELPDLVDLKQEPIDTEYCASELTGDYCTKEDNLQVRRLHKLLEQHEKILNQRPFPCSDCWESFNSPKDLIAHKKTHPINRIHCMTCGKFFSSHSNLKAHMKTVHTEEKPYICGKCSKSYLKFSSFKMHYDKYHPNSIYELISGKTYISSNDIEDHMSDDHSTKNTAQSEECSKSFNASGNERLQSQIYDRNDPDVLSEKYFPCKKCGMKFSVYSDMLRHGKTHNRKNQVVCKNCWKGFKHMRALQEHKNFDCSWKPQRSIIIENDISFDMKVRERRSKAMFLDMD